MDATKTEAYRSKLLELKTRYEEDRHRLLHHDETMAEETSELSDYDFKHPGDASSELYTRELEQSVGESAATTVVQIDGALQRITDGTYGVCAECGKSIGASRLEALPYAAYCIDCQTELEPS
jgi:RNA polymerase-binding protein DksA